VVSTADKEIAEVAQKHGAEVIWRPCELSGDAASSESALLHALDYLRETENYEPDFVVFLQATSPLRKPTDVEAAIQILREQGADSLFSASPAQGFIWRVEAGVLRSLSYDHRRRPRRQEAPEDVIENGSIYVFKPWVLRQLGNRLGGKIAVYRMEPLYSFQVDEPADLEVLERLIQMCSRPVPHTGVRWSEVKLLVLDFDGVLTDNRVLVTEDGVEAVLCHRGDGWGLARLKAAGLPVYVISTETNPVVEARCRKLGIHFLQGCQSKLTALQKLAADQGVAPEGIAYVGNDVNDAECLKWVGSPIAVADAVPEVKTLARFVTESAGGRGAVRELADLFARAGATGRRPL
jgi:N-acylneuraminate cytidylyltransferase